MDKQKWTLVGSAGLGAGLGAGLMYLLDPQGGNRRRAAARAKTVSAAKKGGTAALQTSKHLGNRTKGLVLETGKKLRRGDQAGESAPAPEFSSLAGEGAVTAVKGRKKWIAPSARVLTGTTGSALAFSGLKRRGKIGVALGAVGLGLLAHGLSKVPAKRLVGGLRKKSRPVGVPNAEESLEASHEPVAALAELPGVAADLSHSHADSLHHTHELDPEFQPL